MAWETPRPVLLLAGPDLDLLIYALKRLRRLNQEMAQPLFVDRDIANVALAVRRHRDYLKSWYDSPPRSDEADERPF